MEATVSVPDSEKPRGGSRVSALMFGLLIIFLLGMAVSSVFRGDLVGALGWAFYALIALVIARPPRVVLNGVDKVAAKIGNIRGL